ncbi:PAS domain-containing protein [Sphingomonas sp. M1A8_2b]
MLFKQALETLTGFFGNAMIIGHSISSAAGVIQSIDEPVARVLQRTQRELIGMSYTAITHPEDLARNVSQVEALRPNGPSQSIRKRYITGDGSVITLDVHVSRFGSGDTSHLVGTMSTVPAPATTEAGLPKDGLQQDAPRTADDLPHNLWRRAKDLLAVMQARDRVLGGDLFADHAWGLLLSVYVAEAESRIATADSIARQMGLNRGTLDRWIRVLEAKSLVEPPEDLQRDALQLTRPGIDGVERLLATRAMADVS